MNKSELRDAMAEGAGISKADAGRALDAFIDATSNALKGGERGPRGLRLLLRDAP